MAFIHSPLGRWGGKQAQSFVVDLVCEPKVAGSPPAPSGCATVSLCRPNLPQSHTYFQIVLPSFFKQENNIVLGMPILFPITPCNQISHIFLAVSLLEGYILLESINFSQILAQVLPLLYHIIFFVVSKFIRLNL